MSIDAARPQVNILEPDLKMARKFLHALDPDAEGFTFQTFDDRKGRARRKLLSLEHGSFEDHAKRLVRLNRAGAGVFVCVNQTDLTGRKVENIVRARAVWQEDDTGWSGQLPLKPTMMVCSSPGKFHRYWIVDDLPIDRHAAVMETMVRRFGSDKNAKDITRVLRVPGFFHTKGEPHLVKLAGLQKRIFTADEIYEAFPPYSAPQRPAPQRTSFHSDGTDDISRLTALDGPLNAIPSQDRDVWMRVGMALADLTGKSAQGLSIYDQWSSAASNYDQKAVEKAWSSYGRASGPRVQVGTIYAIAKEHGWRPPVKVYSQPQPAPKREEPMTGSTVVQGDFSRQKEDLTLSCSDLLMWTDSRNPKPQPSIANVATILMNEPAFAGKIAFDEHKMTVVCKGIAWNPSAEWREWRDIDDIRLADWLQRRGIAVKVATCAEGVSVAADQKKFHPIRDYLSAQVWDGTPRLDTWLSRLLNVPQTPVSDGYARCWMIAAVARIFEPGCKVDTVLLLEGIQGLRKSTALRSLVPNPAWFTDGIGAIETKDAAQALHGAWIIEMAEMSEMTRSEIETIKSFFSRAVDRYRPSYGRRTQEFPRSCVFAGTTNSDVYLKDETGARRFWSVQCGAIDIDGIIAERDQLWAEAVARYQSGEQWWLDKDLEPQAAEQQEARFLSDPWEGTILNFAERRQTIMISDVMGPDCLDIPVQHQNRCAQMRISAVLKKGGYDRKRSSGGQNDARRPWFYQRREFSLS